MNKNKYEYDIGKGEVTNISETAEFAFSCNDYDIVASTLSKEVFRKIKKCFDKGVFEANEKDGSNAATNSITYLACCLNCFEDDDFCCYIFAKFRGKVWLDGELLTGGNSWINSACRVHLLKGRHILIFETDESVKSESINCRISDLKSECQDDYTALLSKNMAIKTDVVLLENLTFLNQNNTFKISVLPLDRIKYNSNTTAVVEYGKVGSEKVWEKRMKIASGADIPLDDLVTDPNELIGLDIKIYLEENDEFLYKCSYKFRYTAPKDRVECNFKNEGCEMQRLRYISDLDGNEERYYVCLPEGYDPTKKYPLVVNIATVRYSAVSQIVSDYSKEPLIAADITPRGITLGSYIGEASVTEAIDMLKEKYAVDEDRVYLIGHSNGASAAWVQAQMFPHLYAGIFLLSGRVNLKKLMNTSNIGVINLSSTTDYLFEKAWQKPHEILKERQNYLGIELKGYTHFQISAFRGKEKIYDYLLKFKRNEYPRKIDFYTDFNRHLRSYWLSIHSICFGSDFAELHAGADEHKICINIKNATGISVLLPPFIDRKAFSVEINGSLFNFKNFNNKEIHFAVKRDGVEIIGDFDDCDFRKGAGLLDVYFKPVQIITTEFDQAEKIAAEFSHPWTNGYEQQIHIRYPVSYVSELSSLPDEKNLIIIDNNSENELLTKVREFSPIKMFEDGFLYNGEFHKEKYCIMQVFSLPDKPQRTILYINTNDINLYQRNFFMRKLIIPTYINGYHRFLNNEALLFDGRKFHRIYEWGMKIEQA